MKNIIALGAENKNTFSSLTEKGLYTSRAVDDLTRLDNFTDFERDVRAYLKNMAQPCGRIACDSHPDYLSTRLAEKLQEENSGAVLVKVQHHFAHILSCMLDNGLDNEVIGVAFDGAGYGSDGNIWGGEFLVCAKEHFERLYHFKYMPEPGANSAAKEPWRMAVSYLAAAFGPDMDRLEIGLFKRIEKEKVRVVKKMISEKINSPLTSSAGRLFDAVSSILGICDISHYEGEAAILLEKAALRGIKGRYSYEVSDQEIDVSPMIKEIIRDMDKNVNIGIISAKFHNTLGEIIFDVSGAISRSKGINEVVVSGGCFQNKYLIDYITERFKASPERPGASWHRSVGRASPLKLFTHKKYSPTDLGISVGQVVAGLGYNRD